MKRYCYLYFFIFLIFISKLSIAKTTNLITLQGFVTVYFSQNENLKNLNLDLKLAESERDKIDNHLSSILSISPEQKNQKDNILNPSWDRQKTLTTEFSQNLPTGTSVRVGATKWLENSFTSSPTQFNKNIDNNYYLRLEQDLWKNGFGFNQRSQTRSAKASFKSAQLNYAIEQAKLCAQSIDIYLLTYKSQTIHQINQEIFDNSKKILSSTKRSYNSKLIRKIDYLTAQSDHLNNEQRLKAAKIELETQKTALNTAIKKPISNNISLLKPDLKTTSQTSTALSKKYQEAFQQNVLARKWNHDSQKNLKRPEVKLFVEAAKFNHQFATASSNEDAQSNTLGININIPFNNKFLKASSKESYYKWKKAENEKSYNLRKLQNDLKNSSQQNIVLKEQLEVVERQKVLQKKQTREARKLLRSGQIEFRDYILYRDSELRSEVNWVDLMHSYLSNQVLIAVLTDPSNNYCQRALK